MRLDGLAASRVPAEAQSFSQIPKKEVRCPLGLGSFEPLRADLTMDKQLLFERHFTPQQIAALWGRSARFIRELFQDEPGVQRVDRPERMHKRGYCSIRIPESVMIRVGLRLQNRARAKRGRIQLPQAPTSEIWRKK